MIIEPDQFCREVENLHAYHGMCMFDSLFAACEKYGVDYDMVGPLVNRSIREKLKYEAVNRNMIKRETHSLFSDS